MPGMGGTQRLSRAVGKYKAMELILLGEMFTAEDALVWGLVNKVVPSEALMDEAKSIAKKIATKPPLAVRAVKNIITKAFEVPLSQGLELERTVFNGLFATEDQKEGMKAFIEKRKPAWRGK